MAKQADPRPARQIDVLDKGYVRLVDSMGSDLTVVNAARVSFNRESSELNDADRRLIAYLARHNHNSPFRHAMLQFEIYAPLMVARQWWKYVVGSDHVFETSWNESSKRYVLDEVELMSVEPDAWRSTPENRKQGSGPTLPAEVGAELSSRLSANQQRAVADYEAALAAGVAVEQARLFLPAYGLYVRWRWTASLLAVSHFLNQRLASDAQHEIGAFAGAVRDLVSPLFPESLAALLPEAAGHEAKV